MVCMPILPPFLYIRYRELIGILVPSSQDWNPNTPSLYNSNFIAHDLTLIYAAVGLYDTHSLNGFFS